MSGRTLILFIAAVVIAAATAFYVRSRIAKPDVRADITRVLAASNNITAGSFVHAEKDLVWIEWPKNNINPALITEQGNKIEEYNGAVARRSILSGEAIVRNSLVRSSEGGFMSAVLSPGSRAVSIAVNLTSGNAGFIFPGDRVDLILTHRISVQDTSGDNVLASETFVENVRVVAIDQMLDNPDNKAVIAKTITLEVTPKQAEMVNVATSLGQISVSLRSLGTSAKKLKEDEAYTRDTDVSRLLGSKGSVRARVNVIRGSETEQIDFHQDPDKDRVSSKKAIETPPIDNSDAAYKNNEDANKSENNIIKAH